MQTDGRSDSGHDDGGQHGGHDDVEKVISGVEGGNSDQQNDQRIERAGSGYLKIQDLAQPASRNPASETWDGIKPDPAGEQKRRRSQYDGGGEIASIPRHRREDREKKGQRQSGSREQKAQPGRRIFPGDRPKVLQAG